MEADFTERKKKLWKQLKPKIEEEVAGKYEVDVDELYDDSECFRPIVKITDWLSLEAQCYIGSNSYHALMFVFYFEGERRTIRTDYRNFRSAIEGIGSFLMILARGIGGRKKKKDCTVKRRDL